MSQTRSMSVVLVPSTSTTTCHTHKVETGSCREGRQQEMTAYGSTCSSQTYQVPDFDPWSLGYDISPHFHLKPPHPVPPARPLASNFRSRSNNRSTAESVSSGSGYSRLELPTFDQLAKRAVRGQWADEESEYGERDDLRLHEIEDATTPRPPSPVDEAFIIKPNIRQRPAVASFLDYMAPNHFPPPVPHYHGPPPRPYHPDYPHPIGVYASQHVNRAAVLSSGFDHYLAAVAAYDRRVLQAVQIDPAVLVPYKCLEKEGNENSSPIILGILHEAARAAEHHANLPLQHEPHSFCHGQSSVPFPTSPPTPTQVIRHRFSSISLVSLKSVSEHSEVSVPTPCTPHQAPRRRESMPVILGGRGQDGLVRRVSMPLMKRVGALRLEHAMENSPSLPSMPVLEDPASPSKYKTEACQAFWLHGSCEYGRHCVFLHSGIETSGGIPGITRPFANGLSTDEQDLINAEVYGFLGLPDLDSQAVQQQTPAMRRASSDMVLSSNRWPEATRHRHAASGSSHLLKSSSLSNLHAARHDVKRAQCFDPFATSPSRTPKPLADEPSTDADSLRLTKNVGRQRSQTLSSACSSPGKASDGSWDYTASSSIWR